MGNKLFQIYLFSKLSYVELGIRIFFLEISSYSNLSSPNLCNSFLCDFYLFWSGKKPKTLNRNPHKVFLLEIV